MTKLAAAYKAADAAVLARFAMPPDRVLDQSPAPRPWDEDLAEALRDYNEALGAPKKLAGTEAVIVTGQQPGLFTGPFYTILKAITAIQLAAAVQDKHGIACLPVFWVGSEDHDFDEARSVHVFTKDHRDLPMFYTPNARVDGLPMYRVPAEKSLHNLVEQIAAETAGSEWRDEVRDVLHATLDAADSFSDWTARMLAHLFQDTPLLLYSPHLAAGRRKAADIIRMEIERPLESTQTLNEAGHTIERMGYPPQVMKGETECNFFLEVENYRRKVLYERGLFRLPETRQEFAKADLLALLDAAPERFSPNVALRPVVQQHLFPTLAYVAGPGEIAYWAQLKEVFAQFHQPMPAVYPRAEAVIGSLKLSKLLRKLKLNVDDMFQPMEILEAHALRSVQKHPALSTLERHRTLLLEQLSVMKGELEAATRKEEPWQAMLPNLTEQLQQMLDRLERAVLHNDEAQVEATRKQLQRLSTALAPGRKPQDRVYTIFSWLFEYGWALIPRLMREIDRDYTRRYEVEL